MENATLSLFDHNQRAYDAALRMMAEEGKAAVIHPTGTGKSFIGFKLADDHPNARVCWFSPNEYIFRTQVENLKITGCRELKNIEYITYAKLMLSNGSYVEELKPDFIILDEFHRCGAAEWGKGVSRLLAAHPDAKILGLSASHIRYLDHYRDVADELFDRKIASEMTLGEAIVQNILPAPTYVISVYAYQRELEAYTERVNLIKNAGIRRRGNEYIEALRRALEKADGLDVVFKKHIRDKTGKYIVFCSNIEHLKEIVLKVPEWFADIDKAPRIYTAYSDHPEANSEFQAFKKDNGEHLKLLFCIDMLNEGIHVDDISGVILSRPTVSPIIYKQQIGRALSANKAKSPIIFDIVNNFENLNSIGSIQEEMFAAIYEARQRGDSEQKLVNTSFKIIDETLDCRELFARVQNVLSSSWEEYYTEAKAYFEAHGNLKVPYGFVTQNNLSLGKWIITQRRIKAGKIKSRLLNEEREVLLSQIGMVWDNISDASWERGFAYAKKYFDENGNLTVRQDYQYEGFNLGNWLRHIRSARANQNALITDQRVAELDKMGMIWNIRDFNWFKSYNAAAAFFKEHGHLNVPIDYVDHGIYLGQWIVYQRVRKKGKNKTVLSEVQIAKLDELKMDWEGRDLKWEKMYEEARRYFETFGNLDVPAAFITENGVKLGSWLYTQRMAKNMDDQKRQKLNSIGMVWSKDTWEKFFSLAQEYFEAEGDLNIACRYESGGKVVGKWVFDQRLKYREGKLSPEKAKRLESIGIDWLTPKERAWENNFDEVRKYFETHGSLRLLYKENEGSNRWIKNQRTAYRNGHLTDDRANRLKSLGVVLEKVL